MQKSESEREAVIYRQTEAAAVKSYRESFITRVAERRRQSSGTNIKLLMSKTGCKIHEGGDTTRTSAGKDRDRTIYTQGRTQEGSEKQLNTIKTTRRK